MIRSTSHARTFEVQVFRNYENYLRESPLVLSRDVAPLSILCSYSQLANTTKQYRWRKEPLPTLVVSYTK